MAWDIIASAQGKINNSEAGKLHSEKIVLRAVSAYALCAMMSSSAGAQPYGDLIVDSLRPGSLRRNMPACLRIWPAQRKVGK